LSAAFLELKKRVYSAAAPPLSGPRNSSPKLGDTPKPLLSQ
jgi:hypothetical protein